MGEQVYHRAQACSGTNLRRCQDLGDSILLILGSFILLNVGINVVTLLWKHLKNSLRTLFHHFFPKDKQPAGLHSRPVCMRCTADPKNLCSRMSSRFHRRPNFLLGHVNHFDSWLSDTNDENISRCCWMPPQCGHGRVPTETPWKLWKEELMGAGEVPQATVMKTQVSLFSRPEISLQFPKISKGNMAPPSSPQDNKAPDDSPSHAPAQALTYSSTNTHKLVSTQSLTQTSEPTHFRTQGLEHTSAHTPLAHAPDFISASIPALSKSPIPANASPPTPSHKPAPTSPYPQVQAATHSQTHTLGQPQPHILPPITFQVPDPIQAPGLAPSPEQTSAHTSPQPPAQAPSHASFQSQGHDPVQILVQSLTSAQADVTEQTSQAPVQIPAHSLPHSYAHATVPGPTSVPAPHPTFVPASCALVPVPACAPAPTLALSMTMTTTEASAQVPVTTSTPSLPPDPSVLTTFAPSFPTGHIVYDARRGKQNIFLKHNSQNLGYFRNNLNTLSRPQEVKGLVNAGTAEHTQNQPGGDSAEPPPGAILGYLELGNMEWKISDNAKDKFSQPKTFPYCSFHPCYSESKDRDPQAPVYPKFLVYSQDTTPSKPCFHSPSTAQSTLPTTPLPCTLALPLTSPRTFVVPQSNCCDQKILNLTQIPAFLSASQAPQTVSFPYFSVPCQFSSISQTLNQPPNSENQNLNQGFGLQKTPFLAKESGVSRNPGLPQDPSLQKNPGLPQDPGLQKNPGLPQDPGLQINPGLPQDPGLQKNPGLPQDPGLQKNPGLPQDPGLQKNPGLPQDPGLQKNPGLPQDPGLQKNPGLPQDPGLQKNRGLTQNLGLHKNPSLTQDPGLYKNPGLTLNPGLHKNSGFYTFPVCIQDPYLCMYPNNSKDACLQKNLDITKDSGLRISAAVQDAAVLRSLGSVQPSSLHKNVIFNQTSGQRTLSFMQDSVVYRNAALNQDTIINKNKGLCSVTDQKRPDPSQDSGGNNDSEILQHPGVCRNVGLTQDPRPLKNLCHTQDSEINKNSVLIQESSSLKTSCHHKSSGFTQDSGDYKNLGLTQNPAIYGVPGLNQDADSHKSSGLINVTATKERSDLNQDVGIYSSQHSQDPNLKECPAINQDSGHHLGLAVGQGPGFKTPGLSQQNGPGKDSGLILNSGLNKKTSFAPGSNSAQLLGALQTLKLASSPVKSPGCKMDSQKNNTEQHVSWTSVPVSQSPCPSKAQVLPPDLKTFSDVPVLIELQPPSRQLDSQNWGYSPVDTVPPVCQKYRQMSMPPKINWRPHCPGPGTRTGHVVFDSRQKQLVTGREKCEALSPRRPRQESLKTVEEIQKEWGYQNVMKTLDKKGANMNQE